MKKMKIGIFITFIILLTFSAFAAQINSTTYKQIVTVSTGGENVSSSSYKTNIAIGIIAKIINSTSYINKLGFFHIWLLADGQPCTSAQQCEGGFCCSNLCRSSACPTAAAEAAPSAGGGAAAAAAGGGGGEGLEEKVEDFSISTSSIKEKVALGATVTKTIVIKNTGNTALSFALNVATLNDFVFLSDNSFSLEPSQEKSVEVNIIGKKLGSYIGEVEITANEIKKSISIVVDVESEEVLFDVKIDIPSAYKEVKAGDELKAQITLLNVGPARKVDVSATYLIKDKRGNVIYESSETFAVEKQISFVKSFNIPKNSQPGDYLAVVEVRYADSFAVSSNLFRVVPAEEIIIKKVKSGTALLIPVAVGIVFLFAYLLMPRMSVSAEKCNKIISKANDALEQNDITKARKLYTKAKNLYSGLSGKNKKIVYDGLKKLHNKLKTKTKYI